MKQSYGKRKQTLKIRWLFGLWETIDNLAWWLFNRYADPFAHIRAEKHFQEMENRKG